MSGCFSANCSSLSQTASSAALWISCNFWRVCKLRASRCSSLAQSSAKTCPGILLMLSAFFLLSSVSLSHSLNTSQNSTSCALSWWSAFNFLIKSIFLSFNPFRGYPFRPFSGVSFILNHYIFIINYNFIFLFFLFSNPPPVSCFIVEMCQRLKRSKGTQHKTQ